MTIKEPPRDQITHEGCAVWFDTRMTPRQRENWFGVVLFNRREEIEGLRAQRDELTTALSECADELEKCWRSGGMINPNRYVTKARSVLAQINAAPLSEEEQAGNGMAIR